MRTIFTTAILAAFSVAPATAGDLTPIEQLGKSLFFDESFSVNQNQSCASCHDPAEGFASPDAGANAGGGVVGGSVAGRFGNRKPPSAAYASFAPVFHHTFEDGEILFVGGNFFDGRATGHVLGSAVADQAMGPFTNPVEMALPHEACVAWRACGAHDPAQYPVSMADVWGPEICAIDFPSYLATSCTTADATVEIGDSDLEEAMDAAFKAVAKSIGAYEGSPEVNQFCSRFDDWQEGKGTLTEQELAGFKLFDGKAECSACHVLDHGPKDEPAVFTDFTYDNLGVPKNPQDPVYAQPARFNAEGADFIDTGLAGFLVTDEVYDVIAPQLDGKQKVPTLRNLDKRSGPDMPRSYMHNGYFHTLEGVVNFYNTRDVKPRCETDLPEAEAMAAGCWPAPEVEATVNHDELGNLGLTPAEEADLVAFLKTLTDE